MHFSMKYTVYPAFILNQEAQLLRKCADTSPLFLCLAPYKKKNMKLARPQSLLD